MKTSLSLMALLTLTLISCLTYNEETEQKFQQNKAFIEQYTAEIGYGKNPFLEIIPESNMDKQRKKRIALMPKEELRKLIDQQVIGVPQIDTTREEYIEFKNDIQSVRNLSKRYEILTENYPRLIMK